LSPFSFFWLLRRLSRDNMRCLQLLAVLSTWAGQGSASTPDTVDWRGLAAVSHGRWTHDIDLDNATSHHPRIVKRATINDFLDKGRMVSCLMQNTEDGAQAESNASPWLKGTMIASQYTEQNDLVIAGYGGWYYEPYPDVLLNTYFEKVQPALESLGGGAGTQTNYKGVSQEWQYNDGQLHDTAGDPVVRRETNAHP
jgi:hypothetical protein